MLDDSSTRALRNDIFPPKKGHYVYSNVVLSATAHFEACSAIQPMTTLRRYTLLALKNANKSPAWRVLPGEAWLLTFDIGDEVVSEGGVGAGVMVRGAETASAQV